MAKRSTCRKWRMTSSSEKLPRVSTVIPVYNGEQTVRETIESALAQDFGSQEVIVVNDGSTDGTVAVLASYGSRIRVVSQVNRGLAATRNVGARVSCGEFLAFLDADDIWLPNKISKSVEALDRNPSCVVAFSGVSRMDAAGASLPPQAGDGPPVPVLNPSLADFLNARSSVPASSVVIRRTAFERMGGYCEEFKLAFEDWYLPLEARELGGLICIPEPLVKYRISPWNNGSKYLKYYPDALRFVSLVNRRFGQPKSALRKCFLKPFASAFMSRALASLDSGEVIEAIPDIVKAIRLQPSCLSFFLPSRLLSSRNKRRIRRILVGGRLPLSR